MCILMRSKTIPNDWARAWTAFLLVAAQCVLLSGANCQPGGGGPTDGQGDPTNGPGGGNQGTSVQGLSAQWAVERGTGGAAVWGHASTTNITSDATEIGLSIEMDDGSAPYLTIRRNADGSLAGYWRTSFMDMPASADAVNWTATESADHNTLAGTWASEAGAVAVNLYRAHVPDSALTGVWTRASDAATVIAACDGQSLLLSVLDAGGDWLAAGQFDASVTGSERLTGTGLVGLVFANGTRMHIQLEGPPQEGMLLQKAATQSEVNGRWVIGDRRYRGDTVQRGISVVVVHNGTLYTHDNWDYPQALTRSVRAPLSGSAYAGSAAGGNWSGRLSPNGLRIVGAWDGYQNWYNSLDRAIRPNKDELTGTWHSVSLDWAHHDATGAILRDYGMAQIVQTGDTLTVTDTYPGGAVYQVSASWRGDHYEGTWWNTASPGDTYPWRGEFLANGFYLHGTWTSGEYSFSRFPMGSSNSVDTAAQQGGAFVADPYEDTALVLHEASTGTRLTMMREQGQIAQLVYASSQGEVVVDVDARARPTRIEGLNETLTFTWAPDGLTANVTLTKNGTTTTVPVVVDMSDAALLAAAVAYEAQEQVNLTPLKTWLAANPGVVQAITSGATAPPDLLLPPIRSGTPNSKATLATLSQSAGSPYENASVFLDRVLKVATFATLGTAALKFAVKMASVKLVIVFGALGGMAIAAGLVFLTLALLQFIICKPCTLSCFWNCEAGP